MSLWVKWLRLLLYPLAWAVVEGENNDSWQWFLTELQKCVPHDNGTQWTIISDEHPVSILILHLLILHILVNIYAGFDVAYTAYAFTG
jgi:hypothetical protein